MQTERLFKIVYHLLDKKSVTAQELAEYLGVSKRTVFRDINTLSLSGIPIYANKGNRGGIRLMEEFVLNKSVLSEREQSEILSALQGFSTVTAEETKRVLSKLSSFFNKASPNWIEVDFAGWGGGDKFFSDVKTAIFEKRIIEFDYYNSYGAKRRRRVEPIQLCFYSKAWYFKGFCLEKQGVRLYKLSRVRNHVLTGEIFSERELPEPNKDLSDGQRERYANTAVRLVLKIAPEMAYRVYDYYSDDDIIKNDDGSLTVTQYEPEDNGMYGFILSFGEYAEVLEPEHIREIIREKALRIAKKYSEPAEEQLKT